MAETTASLREEASVTAKDSRSPAQHERFVEIEQRLREDGTVRIDSLALSLGVSEMTVRRDLDELEALGVARRVRGGAVPVGPEPFAERHQHNARAKARIADKLIQMLPAAGTIALDASSTVHRLAATIDGARDLVVLTNGLDTFDAVNDRPGVTAALTGGTREPRTGSLVGPLAMRAAEDLLFDLFVCSAAAVHPALGPSEASLAEAEVKRVFARNSSQTIVAVDHTKLGSTAQARVFRWDDIDALATDLASSDPRLDPYRGSVEII